MPAPKESFADWLDEQKCIDVLREERWPDGIVKCPYCHSTEVFILGNYKQYYRRYKCNSCSIKDGETRTFNDKTGTIYEHSKLPITKWFYAISLLRNKVSDLELSRELQVDYNTARRMSMLIKATIFLPGK